MGLLGDRLRAGAWKQRGVSRHHSCSCFLFFNFQLCWVFISMHGLSLVAEHGLQSVLTSVAEVGTTSLAVPGMWDLGARTRDRTFLPCLHWKEDS